MTPRSGTARRNAADALDGPLAVLEDVLCRYFSVVAVLSLLADVFIAALVVRRIPYTEIDWRAYMQEVAGVLEDGQLDYKLLRGDTGPLVYPAGFIYIYSILYYVTDRGSHIPRAQAIFVGLHATVLLLVMSIYKLCREDSGENSTYRSFSLFIVATLPLSRRIMSLFVLRLFNESFQVLLIYLSVMLFAENKWSAGCLLYSAAVSVKMNALLYAPGLVVLLCQALGPISALAHVILICGGFQVAVGLPFLLHAPGSYLKKAFEFSRVFEYKWSVNGAFLSESTFLDQRLSFALLACHLSALLLFGHFKWTVSSRDGLLGLIGWTTTSRRGLSAWMTWARSVVPRRLRSAHVVYVLFTSNFIGMVFARTLHYQFYLWYYHTIPLLVVMSRLPRVVGLVLIVAIEVVFNVYPPRSTAALILSACHLALLIALYLNRRAREDAVFQDPSPNAKTS
jgi:alpha-1,3-mannosyltransferase